MGGIYCPICHTWVGPGHSHEPTQQTRSVFLLWDNTPQMKGEASDLVDVFESSEAATREVNRQCEDDGFEPTDFGIEEKEVRS